MTAVRIARVPVSTAAGLIVALGWPFVVMLVRHGRLEYIADVRSDVRVLVTEWLIAIAVLCIMLYWERRSPDSVGWRVPSRYDLRAMGLTLLGMYAVATAAAFAIMSLGHVHAGNFSPTLRGASTLPVLLKIALPLTAGACEEFLFRGYALTRLTEIFRSPAAAAIITIGIFTIAHVPRYGLGPGLLTVAIIATALTALFLWRRSLPVNMLAHGIIDGISLLVLR